MYWGNYLIPGNSHESNSPDYRLESGRSLNGVLLICTVCLCKTQESNNNDKKIMQKSECRGSGFPLHPVWCVHRPEYLRQHGATRKSSLAAHSTGYRLSPAHPFVRPVMCFTVRHIIYKSILKVLQTSSDEEFTISLGNCLFITFAAKYV